MTRVNLILNMVVFFSFFSKAVALPSHTIFEKTYVFLIPRPPQIVLPFATLPSLHESGHGEKKNNEQTPKTRMGNETSTYEKPLWNPWDPKMAKKTKTETSNEATKINKHVEQNIKWHNKSWAGNKGNTMRTKRQRRDTAQRWLASTTTSMHF